MSSSLGLIDHAWKQNTSQDIQFASARPTPPAALRTEPLRTLEPSNSQTASMPYLTPTAQYNDHDKQRPHLPGVQDLLSPRTQHELQPPDRWQHQASLAANPTLPTTRSAPWPNPPPSADRRSSLLPGIFDVPARSHYPPPSHTTQPAYHNGPDSHFPPPHHSIQMRGMQMPTPPAPRPPMSYSSGMMSETVHLERRRDSARPGTSIPTNASECVGQRQIPGKGLCYVYQDGNTCPTVIDGESVNPMWGTTKAGKARKRLAQACLTCREKKIRCEPRQPKCLQCAKSKRDCVMPAIQTIQPDTITGATPHLTGQSISSGDPSVAGIDATEGPLVKRRRSTNHSRAVSYSSSGAKTEPVPARTRLGDNDSYLLQEQVADRLSQNDTDIMRALPLSRALHAAERNDGTDPVAWDSDPYEVEPDKTIRLLDNLFVHRRATDPSIFPKIAFMQWVRTCKSKTQDECMVLYSLLACSSKISENDTVFAKTCADRASLGLASKSGKTSLPLIQTRVFLATYNSTIGREAMSWEYNGAARQAICVEGLNTEVGCSRHEEQSDRNIFNFTYEQLVECRRRTFWFCFILDRYTASNGLALLTFRPTSIYLRLPCSDMDFEGSVPNSAPHLENAIIDPSLTTIAESGSMSPLAYLITIAQIWSDVTCFVQPALNHSAKTYAYAYRTFFEDIQARLERWKNSLPAGLQYNTSNLRKSVQDATVGILLHMHSTYHACYWESVRYVHHQLLGHASTLNSLNVVRFHARKVLAIAEACLQTQKVFDRGLELQTGWAPFGVYAMTSAIDSITAGGSGNDIQSILDEISPGYEVLQVMSRVWQGARTHINRVDSRIAELRSLAQRGNHSSSWRLRTSIGKTYERHYDILYGADDNVFFKALGRIND